MSNEEKIAEQKEMKRKWRIVVKALILQFFVFAVLCVALPVFIPIAPSWKILVVMVGIVVSAILSLYFIYFWLAPENLFFTLVKEGTARIIVKGGAVKTILMQFRDRKFDDRWNVVGLNSGETDKKRLFGGLRFYGIWPFSDVFTYKFSWTSRRQDGELSEHKKELLDYVLLTGDVYFGKVGKAETKDLLPLKVEFLVGAKITNPYKTAYEIQDWLEAAMSRIVKAITSALTERTYENWINSDGADLSARIYNDPQTQELFSQSRDIYGVEISSVEVLEIDPGEEFRKATLAKYEGERKAEEAIAENVAALDMLAAYYGVSREEMQKRVKGGKDKNLRKFISEFIILKTAISSGGYQRRDYNGLPEGSPLTGIAAMVADALSGKQPGAKAPAEETKPVEERKKKIDEAFKALKEKEAAGEI